MVSNIKSVIVGGALDVDIEGYKNSSHYTGPDQFQNYDQLITTSSLSNESIDEIINEVNNSNPNLNINYSKFENHVFLITYTTS